MMGIGVPRESINHVTRVAAMHDTVEQLWAQLPKKKERSEWALRLKIIVWVRT